MIPWRDRWRITTPMVTPAWHYDDVSIKITDGSVILRTARSRSERNACERVAWMFKREMGYDFVQYEASEPDPDHRDTALLWLEPAFEPDKNRAVGAVSFRWRKWKDAPESYGMQWAWLHPHRRDMGIMRMSWGIFRERFGAFHVERPLSQAMQAVVRAMGHEEAKQ